MIIRIFWKENCPNCPPAKELGVMLTSKNINVEYYNILEVDGLAKAQIHNVLSTPTIILLKKDEELSRWNGHAPGIAEINKYLNSNKVPQNIKNIDNKKTFVKIGTAKDKITKHKDNYIECNTIIHGQNFRFNLFVNKNKTDTKKHDFIVSGNSEFLNKISGDLPKEKNGSRYIYFGIGNYEEIKNSKRKRIKLSINLMGSTAYPCLFPNSYKRGPSDPDYFIKISDDQADAFNFEIMNYEKVH